MKKRLIIFILFIEMAFSIFITHEESGWSYFAGGLESFYVLEEILINGENPYINTCADGCSQNNTEYDEATPRENISNKPIVGAFYGDLCIGWSYIDSLYTTVSINYETGFDLQNDVGLWQGTIPTSIKLFEYSTNSIYTLDVSIYELSTLGGLSI